MIQSALPLASPPRRRQGASRAAGFSLAELAIVLVIVSLVIGGLVVPLSAQLDIRNISETRRAMAEIREALLGFAAANGRLPCPAASTTASGVVGAGMEGPLSAAGVCQNADASGVLPWATLGVNETDAWGRRYSYRVTNVFAQSVPPPPSWVPPVGCTASPRAAFVLCSKGTLNVRSTRSAAGGSVVASLVPAVVISHGRNGNGAYTPRGTQLAIGTDADEHDNQLRGNVGAFFADPATATDTDFVSKAPTSTFDDEVVWISSGVLFNRMISAGKLP